MIQFGLKKAILESGLKQSFIAQKVGIDQTTLSKKINGHIRFEDKEKIRIAKVLDQSIYELFLVGKEPN